MVMWQAGKHLNVRNMDEYKQATSYITEHAFDIFCR
jgi:hypothetical protein